MAQGILLSKYLELLPLPEGLDRSWLVDEFLTNLRLNTPPDLVDEFEDAVLASSFPRDERLQIRPGGWHIRASASLIKTALTFGLLAVGLTAIGANDVPVQLMPVVLPLLIDVEKARLNRRDQELLVPLRFATSGLEGYAVNPVVLYNRLDRDVRDQLNYDDFTSFVQRLIDAGEMDDAGLGDVRAREPGRPAWIRLTFT